MSKEQLKKKGELLGRVVKNKKGNHKPDRETIFGKWRTDDFVMTLPEKKDTIKAYGFCVGCGLPARFDERSIDILKTKLEFEYLEEKYLDGKTYFEYDECNSCGDETYKNIRITEI